MTALEQTSTDNPSPASHEGAMQPPHIPEPSSNTKWFVIGGIMLLVIIVGVILVSSNKNTQNVFPAPTQQVTQPTTAPSPQPTKPRSKAPGVVLNAVTASSLDPKTGTALNPTATFTPTDREHLSYLLVL